MKRLLVIWALGFQALTVFSAAYAAQSAAAKDIDAAKDSAAAEEKDAAQETADKFTCLPDESGLNWNCVRGISDTVRRSRLSRPSRPDTAPRSPSRDEPETPADVLQQAAEEPALVWDRVTGRRGTEPEIGPDPEDWYTPTPTRPAAETHTLREDLAASVYVELEDDGVCRGGYRVREYPVPLEADDADYPMIAEADGIASEIDESATLTGNVTIEQGNRLIRAQVAEVDQVARVVTFPKGVVMDQPGLLMQGDVARVHVDSKEAELNGVQFVLVDANMRGHAETMEQGSSGDLTLTENSFTRCEPGNNGWRLNTDKLVIEEDEVFGTARDAVLRLGRVPVFYSPYLKFPVSDERVSGFLFPNLGYSDEDGVDLSVPYYLNLAPNYDATIVPRYMSERGAGLEAEFRHKSSWQDTTLTGAYLPEDDLYNGVVDEDDYDELGGAAVFGPFDPADRWLGSIDHRGRFGPFRTLIDATSVSDRDYFRDLGSDLGVSSRIELGRKAEIQFNRGGLFMRLWGQEFQRLDERRIDDYRRLPEFEAQYTRPLGPLEVSLGAKWADFDRDTDGLAGLTAVTGERLHVEPRVRLPLSWPFGFLTVSGGYRHTSYDLEQDSMATGAQLVDDQPDRNIGLGSVDGGLIFERPVRLFGQDLLQTLEPRVYYLWQEFDDQSQLPRFDASRLTFGYQQLYRDNRFSGLDRIGDANQASFGVTTRFLSSTTGQEYFRFSLGEIFYFEDRRVTLSGPPRAGEEQSSSAIASEMSARLAKHWRVRGTFVWDPHDSQVDESGISISYRSDNRHIFNVGFRNRRSENQLEDIEQSDVSLYWPLFGPYALVGRWNYDFESERTIEGFGGLEYSNCCLQVRLLARRFLDAPTTQSFAEVEGDEGVFLQIVFKGLAGFGTKVESVLERGVRGYRSPERGDYFSNSAY